MNGSEKWFSIDAFFLFLNENLAFTKYAIDETVLRIHHTRPSVAMRIKEGKTTNTTETIFLHFSTLNVSLDAVPRCVQHDCLYFNEIEKRTESSQHSALCNQRYEQNNYRRKRKQNVKMCVPFMCLLLHSWF